MCMETARALTTLELAGATLTPRTTVAAKTCAQVRGSHTTHGLTRHVPHLRFPAISVSNSRLALMVNLALMAPLRVHQVPLDHMETVAADQVVLPREVQHVSVQYALHVPSAEHVQ